MLVNPRSSPGEPPLRARLHRYKLTVAEFALLTAMVEHCSDGSTIRTSAPRLAAYSKLSRRQVDRVTQELVGCGILTELAPSRKGSKRRCAIYRLNEEAMQLDPRMQPYLRQTTQRLLPGILKPKKPLPAPMQPVSDLPPAAEQSQGDDQAGLRTLDTTSTDPADLGHHVHETLDTMSTDPKASSNPTPEVIHHGDAALNSLPAWLAVKEALRAELSAEEWDLWVRPMLLLKAMPVSGERRHLLAALPPSNRIITAAQARLPLLREMLAPAGLNVSLTKYPTDWEADEARRRYGRDMAPKPWRRQ